MLEPRPEGVTALLRQWSEGDAQALGRLMHLVYDELHAIAERQFRREGEAHTLQPTVLVNEVYLRFLERRSVRWTDRTQFFGYAARLMRFILVDHARAKGRLRRGGGETRISLDEAADQPSQREVDVIALDGALQRLEALDPRLHQIVELKFFAGLTNPEIAELVGVSLATVKREWAAARMWLRRELEPAPTGPD